MTYKHVSSRGFTLVETLIAILILTMALSGPIIIAQEDLNATLVAKDQITAYYLAQDGLEYVRSVRDTNNLSGNTNWLATLAPCISTNGTSQCTVDSLNASIAACPTNGPCPPLLYDPNTNGGYFNYNTGSPSIFTRSVSILTPVGIPNGSNSFEAVVTVIVSWQDNAHITRSIQVQENIFNWE